MHEVAVVSNIVDAVLRKLDDYPDAEVESVNLIIGDLTSLGFEQLEFAYGIVTRGTRLEGTKVTIEREEVRVRCRSCGYEGPAGSFGEDYLDHTVPILACPECGGDVDVTAGQACGVRDIEIREAE